MDSVDYSRCCEYYPKLGWVHSSCKDQKNIKGRALIYKRFLDNGEKCAVCKQTKEQLQLKVA